MTDTVAERNQTIDDCFKSEETTRNRSFHYEFVYPLFFDALGFHWLDYARLGKHLNIEEGDAVLEIGPGYPLHLFYSKEVGEDGRYVGLDRNSGLVRKANKMLKRRQIDDHIYHAQGDAYDIQCPDGVFDKVIAVNFWTGEQNDPPGINFYQEVARVLRPGGQYFERFFSHLDNESHQLTPTLTQSGFEDVSQQVIFGGLPFRHQQIVAMKPE